MSHKKEPSSPLELGIGSLIGSVSKLELDALWHELGVAPDVMTTGELRTLCKNLGAKTLILRRSLSAITGIGPSDERFEDLFLASKAWAETSAKVSASLKTREGTINANKSRKIELNESMVDAVIEVAVRLRAESGRLPGKVRTAKLAKQLLSVRGMQASQRKIVTESRVETVLKKLRDMEIAGQWPSQ